MFRYSLFLDALLKAMTHKYIRRVPKGVTKTGKTKYMYFYAGQEGHGRGIAHESELVEGSSFAFGELGKTRYHAHISKVDGDKVTVRYDDGAKKGTEETMTKKQFQALVHGEHATGIKEAQVKADKQLKDFQAGKEKGVKVKQETLDKLAQRVANLKDLVSHIDQPAKVDAPWMSERERRVFEGQNRLFTLLENKEITEALLKDRTNNKIIRDMLKNVITAIFKYKDISTIPKKDLKILVDANKLSYESRIYTYDTDEPLILTLSQLWQKLPYAQQEKNEKVGRLDVIHAELIDQTPEQKKKKAIHIEAVKQAQEAMIKTDPDLAKIIYGNMIFTQVKDALDYSAQGFFATGTPSHNLHNVTTKLDTVYHSADVIYMDTDDHFENSYYSPLPEKAKTYLQTEYFKKVAIHELAHRFSKSLLEHANNDFLSDLTLFMSKYAQKKRDVNDIINKPIQEFTIIGNDSSALITRLLLSPDFNFSTNEISGVLQQGTDSRAHTIKFSDINFEALGESMLLPSEGGMTDLQIPLIDGGKFSVLIEGTPKDFLSRFNKNLSMLPTTYAHADAEECFSEMMAAVCDPNYKDEPMRTDFLNLLKKYKDKFGA
jgi:hypothetical protein